jgi:hypothetical protein
MSATYILPVLGNRSYFIIRTAEGLRHLYGLPLPPLLSRPVVAEGCFATGSISATISSPPTLFGQREEGTEQQYVCCPCA